MYLANETHEIIALVRRNVNDKRKNSLEKIGDIKTRPSPIIWKLVLNFPKKSAFTSFTSNDLEMK